MLPQQGQLLRIFIGESDKHEGIPLYEWIVREAKKQGLAGATVVRGVEGFGVQSRIHASKILALSQDLPVIIEIVDEPNKVEEFLPTIDEVIEEGSATVENVQIRLYRHRDKSKD